MKFTYSIKVRKDGVRRIGRDALTADQMKIALTEKREIVAGPLKTPCWLWLGHKSDRGYGGIMFQSKSWRVSRLSWFLSFGEIPPRREVCHKCDNPSCFNPEHLFVGTHKENMSDAKNKKRLNPDLGESHWNHKLTDDNIREIRRRFVPRTDSRHVLAKEFGVSGNTIYFIAARRSWPHVV